ncbi:MAG: hypothetical protein ACK5Q5_14695 [Planctomycetaceae bacterium]
MGNAQSLCKRTRRKCLAAAVTLTKVVWGATIFVSPPCEAADDAPARAKMVATLRKLAADIQANGNRLKTWSAKGELIEGRPGREGELPWVERKVRVHFERDLVGDRLFTIYETLSAPPPVEFTAPSGDRTRIHYELVERHVVAGNDWIKATPAPTEERPGSLPLARGPGVNSAWRRTRQEAERFMTFSSVIEPRQLLLCYSGNRTFDDGLTGSADWIEKGNKLPLEIKQTPVGDGLLYTLRQSYRQGDATSEISLIVETTYDSLFRHMPVHRVRMTPEGVVLDEDDWAYESVADVLVPFSYRRVKYRSDEVHTKELSREFTFDEIHINEPIDEAWFGWSRLGLVEGDQICDEVEGTLYRFTKGEPAPTGETFSQPKTPRRKD